MKKAVVILGAGASFDCWNGTGKANPLWRPPLARHLFGHYRTLPHNTPPQDFDNILRNYRGARVLAQELVPASVTDSAFDLEQRCAQSRNPPTPGFVETISTCPHTYVRSSSSAARPIRTFLGLTYSCSDA